MISSDTMAELLGELRGKDGARRERARESLVKVGKPAVSALIGLLSDRNEHVRWEACKALGSIKDPAAAGPLVDALNDRNMEVRWLAAEGLIALGRKSVIPLLRALEAHFDSLFLREGAHHVLHALQREDLLDASTLAVLDTLRSLGPRMTVALAARKALESLGKSGF
jgi:HEAT repeat protein